MSNSLRNTSTADLLAEIKRRQEIERARPVNLNKGYTSPIGLWSVSTEGDVEGKSTKELGFHDGHIIDIAYGLADQSCYGLTFKRVTPEMLPKTKHKRPPSSVTIQLDIDSGTWDREMDRHTRRLSIEAMLRKEPSKVAFELDEGAHAHSVQILFKR